MAIVQKSSNSLAAVASFAPSLTGVTAGSTLVLLVGASAFADTTPTDSAGQTWAKVGYLANSGCEVAVYWLQSANAGTHNLTLSHGGSAYPSWSLVEIPSCTAVDVFGTLASASNTATTLSTNAITTTNANDAVFVLFAADVSTGSSNAAITDPPTGYTSVFAQQNTASFAGVGFGYKEVSSTGSQSATWTFNADTTGSLYAAVAVSFKLSAAAWAGAGRATAAGSGALTTQSQLAGSGTAKASGAGSLSGGAISFAGAGIATASGTGALTAKSNFAGAGVAQANGSGSLTVGSAFSVTLKQHWYQPVGQGNPATLTFGSNPLTATSGSTLIAVTSGADLGTQPPPTDSAGTFVIPTNGRQDESGSDHIWCSIAYEANASSGSHTITPGAVAAGGGGEIAHWILELTNMPAVASVRGVFVSKAISTAGSWSNSSDASVQAGDIAIVMAMYENTSPWTTSDLSNPPSGWTSVGHPELDATNFTPTTVAYQVVPTSGTPITASYSTTDPTISEHISIMLVLVPNAGGVALMGAGVSNASGTGALTTKSVLSGAGSAAASGSGSLTDKSVFVGSGATSATGSASLRTAAAPAGTGLAQATGSAALTVSSVFSGAGLATASGSASFTTGSSGANLAGAGVALASGVAALTTASALAGAGVCRAAGAASLTVSSALAGSGSATASGSATLTGGSASVSFVGSGNAQATGSGALTTAAALAGGGFSIATAAGTLSIGGGGVAFAGNGAATTAGIAALTARPRLSGAGVATATGSGAFAVASAFVSGNDAVWLVPARNTVGVVPHRETVAQATTD
jgi:fibronectin-binding autotransporter adhesin